MKTIQEFIKQFEGFQAHAYTCPGGYQTIGYGHRLYTLHPYKRTMTPEEADQWLHADLSRFARGIARLIITPLTSQQHAALLSFTFNVGLAAFERSTLRHKLNRKDFEGSAAEFPKWCWCQGRKLPGLLKRRQAERALFDAHIALLNDFYPAF